VKGSAAAEMYSKVGENQVAKSATQLHLFE